MKTRTVILLTVFILLLDQFTKMMIRKALLLSEEIVIIPTFFSITYAQNTGASFSMLQAYPLFLTICAVAVLGFLLWYYRHLEMQYRLPYALILAGVLGNLIDRLFFGAVTDFIYFHFWPIFNVADMAISIGTMLFVGILLKEEYEERKKKKQTKTSV